MTDNDTTSFAVPLDVVVAGGDTYIIDGARVSAWAWCNSSGELLSQHAYSVSPYMHAHILKAGEDVFSHVSEVIREFILADGGFSVTEQHIRQILIGVECAANVMSHKGEGLAVAAQGIVNAVLNTRR